MYKEHIFVILFGTLIFCNGTELSCINRSITKVDGLSSRCAGDDIINYKFTEKPIDSQIWTVEQYISHEPDWLFNIYQNTPDVVDVENGVLRIRPKLEEENARKDLDLSPGCTSALEQACQSKFFSILNPPIVSGKLQSTNSFSFGNITIRAKLPIGDYMYPEMYLQDISNPQRRIVIAYARGNKNYFAADGTDDGAKKLFGGPYTSVQEPGKSKFLSTYLSTKPIGHSWHTFNVLWTANSIDLFIDGEHFGHHEPTTLQETGFDKIVKVKVVLGVGVGGPYEFPDAYTSSGHKKAYTSKHRNAIKEFLNNKANWIDSWTNDSQLQVEYVSVKAL